MPQKSDGMAPDILIIDDHAATARSLEKLLQKAGYRTQTAHNGADAIAKATASPPTGAAMIDIHLPDFNGLVLAQKLRQQFGPNLPLFVFSGDTSMETIGTLPHIGATYFLSKPIVGSHLLEVIQKWLPAPGVANQSQTDITC